MEIFRFTIKYDNGTKVKCALNAVFVSTAWLKIMIDLKEKGLLPHVVSIKLKKENGNEEN